MDPHSTRSQFKNKRTPTTGPKPSVRFIMDAHSAKSPLPRKTPMPSNSTDALTLSTRPIATNSRVKQDEKFKKDMHLAYVNNSLLQKNNVSRCNKCIPEKFVPNRFQGNPEAFDELVAQFNVNSKDTLSPPGQLRLWILALSHVVSRLDRQYSSLVEAIVNMPWTTMDNAFIRSYTTFIGMLISARPEYLSLILGRVCEAFTHRASSFP